MKRTIHGVLSRSLTTIAALALFAACSSDAIVGAEQQDADLGSCTNLQAPAGSRLTSHLYATGVQIYRWNDTAWVFISPSAVLTSDPAGTSAVGIHYSGPTWQGVSGSKVVGTVLNRCTVSGNAIPWLSLGAVSSDEPGVFQGATFIQRLNTTGGMAPTVAGKVSGEVKSVPYTAEYRFYR